MATFHSVKDAVKLFNSGGNHLNKRQEHGVLLEETNVCLVNKEVNNLKEKIKDVDKTKIEALLELEGAKQTIEQLNHKLGIRQNGMRNVEKDLDLTSNVRAMTSELGELGIRQNVRNDGKALDLTGNVRVVTSELGFAKESLHRVVEEESELCILMESLKLELLNVKKEHSQLIRENEQREKDHQAMEKLNKETQDTKTELLKLEEELKSALFEAEEARTAEKHAKERLNAAETSSVLLDDFRFLDHRKEDGVVELTETEALRACRDETLKKLEMSEREIKDIEAATQDALKKAKMAKEATIIVDVELKRRRKAASKILAESKMSAKSLPSTKEVHKSKPRSSSKEGCLVKC